MTECPEQTESPARAENCMKTMQNRKIKSFKKHQTNQQKHPEYNHQYNQVNFLVYMYIVCEYTARALAITRLPFFYYNPFTLFPLFKLFPYNSNRFNCHNVTRKFKIILILTVFI